MSWWVRPSKHIRYSKLAEGSVELLMEEVRFRPSSEGANEKESERDKEVFSSIEAGGSSFSYPEESSYGGPNDDFINVVSGILAGAKARGACLYSSLSLCCCMGRGLTPRQLLWTSARSTSLDLTGTCSSL